MHHDEAALSLVQLVISNYWLTITSMYKYYVDTAELFLFSTS